ncbi:MAG: Crp/Fnr family transcriptional regulator, partial [Eubacteriales bacterium]
LAFLHEVLPFGRKLHKIQKKQLSDSVLLKTFESGESLHHGAEDCSGLFVIKNGRVRVFILSETGKEITLFRLFERDICIFSASCIFKNINFEIFVEAETKTEALLIPTPVFDRLSRTSLPVADYVSQLMASRFSDAMWVMEQVLFTSFDKRLAAFLLEQANIEGSEKLTITQEAIANHLGSAREVVTRMLKYFHDEGMVELFRGGLIITDINKLKVLA